ncbi:MAG TPA: F0F1 ATP synthase subunit B [Chloroflexia bacterium]|nr:F0F1 ATP synthase subunit B [Chloroflexia bacterium]
MFEALGIVWGNLLWQCLAFGVLIFLLSRFAYTPVVKMLDERANRISESIQQAEQIKADNAAAAKRAQEVIAEAQVQTREMLTQAQQMSQRTIAAAQAEAREQREKMLSDAHAQIETDTQRAKEELQREVARLAILAASRVVGKSLDTPDHYRLVDEALAESEKSRGSFGRG